MQSPHEVIMVRPLAFGFNSETAASNAFQHEQHGAAMINSESCAEAALTEFDSAVKTLENHGVKVKVFTEDDPNAVKKPDSIYPNNWFSTHANGVVFTYPMMAQNRRIEKRQDIMDYLSKNFKVCKMKFSTFCHIIKYVLKLANFV